MKKFQLGSALVGAVALIALTNSPASALDASVWGQSMKAGCAHASYGKFEDNDEIFSVKDTCADGWSAVIKVDVAPYQSDGGYDFAIWNNKGNGTTVTSNRSYPEGTGVCIWAGSGEYSSGEWGSWGPGSCGKA
ncbi:hypothetical protein ACIHEJ_36645 [Streptomyces sp. NPDC052301]|uniref:hypothetical protein n=1 Tax=Streptomyces sp. NPDC052301 TaxID=3365687 RepID=UPI0037CD2290